MDVDKEQSTAAWLKFFKDAGIPTKTGASYALIFVQNRINKDMLSEMTVDYLRLMGITLMGDIIAILRHCKTVHQDSLRKVVILQSKEAPRKYSTSETSASSSSNSSSSSSSSSDDDIEMVEVSKPVSKKTISKQNVREVKTKNTKLKIKTEPSSTKDNKQSSNVKSKVIGKISSSSTEDESVKRVQPAKRKYSISESDSEENAVLEPLQQESSLNSGKSILRTAISSTKKLKAAEEKAIMGPKLPPPKRTVFERLGAENDLPQVTSTTELPKPEVVVETKFTRTLSRVNLPTTTSVKRSAEDLNMDNVLVKGSSVFDRLGGLDKPQPQDVAKRIALHYAGVLKSPPKIAKKPAVSLMKKVGTMRADEPEVPVKLRAATRPAINNSIKNRLGNSLFLSGATPPIKLNRSMLTSTKPKFESEGIFANSKKSTNISVRDRLGLTSSTTHSERPSSTLFKRMTTSSDSLGSTLSRTELLKSKRVSFGRVEHKLISPLLTRRRLQRSNFGVKTSVHNRLGTKRY